MSDEMEEFWQLFRDESEDALNQAEDCLVALEQERGNKDQINTLFRGIHTFKGSSRMMGLTGVESIAHVFEDTVGLIRDKDVELNDEIYNLLIKTIDTFRELLEKILDTRQDYPIDDYMDIYEALKKNYTKYSGGEVSNAPLELIAREKSDSQEASNTTEETKQENVTSEEKSNEENSSVQEPKQETAAESIAPLEAPKEELTSNESTNTAETQSEQISSGGFDPSKDPKFVKVFLEIVESELSQLDKLSDKMNTLDDTLINDIKKTLDNLTHAAENMKYNEIVYAIKRLHAELNHCDNADFTEKWTKLENNLRDELNSLHQDNDKAQESQSSTDTNQSKSHASATENSDTTGKEHDPQTDPTYVKIFSDLTNSELINLRRELDALAEGSESTEVLLKVLDRIHNASENMNYNRIAAKADDMVQLIKGKSTNEIDTNEIANAEIALREEIRAIFNVVDIKHSDDIKEEVMQSNEASSVFVQTYAKQAKHNIDRLQENIVKIKENFSQIKSGESREFDKNTINHVITSLKNIYHTTIFYNLNQTSQMTLVLEDLFARVFQGEITLSNKIIETTDEYRQKVSELLDNLDDKSKIDESFTIELLKNIRSEVFTTSDNQLNKITEKVLDMLNIDDAFRELLTADNLVDISEHLHNGSSFYSLLADLESDEEAAVKFYEITQAENIQAISNVTVYENDRTLFRFLLASTHDEEMLNSKIESIDPDGKYFQLSACSFTDSTLDTDVGAIDDFFDDFTLEDHPEEIDANQNNYTAPNEMADSEIIDSELIDSVGQLVIAHSALVQLVDEVNHENVNDLFTKVSKDNSKDSSIDMNQILDITEIWSENLKNKLSQIMRDFASSLDFLKDLSVKLRHVSINKITKPLDHLIRDTSNHFDKKINFKENLEKRTIDKKITEVALEHLQDIVWFIIVHSIESSKSRQELGKSSSGNIEFKIVNLDDRVQVEVSEDGRGFDESDLQELAQSNNINLNNLESIYDVLLDESVGNYNMGNQSQKGINFSEINESIKLHNGNFKIGKSALGGATYSITLPLSSTVIDGMVVRAGGINYIIPIKSIRRILKPEDNMLNHFSSDGGENYIKLSEEIIRIKTLSRSKSNQADIDLEHSIYVVVESDEKTCAFNIDELVGQQQVLIHPLQGFLNDIPAMSGCAILAGGEIGMVLDVGAVTKLKDNRENLNHVGH